MRRVSCDVWGVRCKDAICRVDTPQNQRLRIRSRPPTKLHKNHGKIVLNLTGSDADIDATDTIASGERRRDQRPQMLQLRIRWRESWRRQSHSTGDVNLLLPQNYTHRLTDSQITSKRHGLKGRLAPQGARLDTTSLTMIIFNTID